MQGEAVPSHEAMAGMQRIYFDFDQFTLSDEARGILAENAKYLQTMNNVQVVIEGHCDERGSDEYNLALGESRALAAKSYLVSLGINPSRLSVISYGEEKPLVNDSGEEAWAQNRRAEFKAVK
jgi:peptidoglycan-associated lipoprotein